MPSRSLIVNADDCNLTSGVTRAILECHSTGIVSSTTFLINLPIDSQEIQSLKKRKRLGVGLHLNVTLGAPVSNVNSVQTLISKDGRFRRIQTDLNRVAYEFENQVKQFKKVFGRLPTHFDTHHHLHQSKKFLAVLRKMAKRYKRPFRNPGMGLKFKNKGIPLFGDLAPKKHWRREKIEACIHKLPEGISEIMCHPGSNDRALKKISSFQRGRTIEWRIFRCRGLKKFVEKQGVELIHYGML